MERTELDRYYRENVGLIHVVAKKGWGRLQRVGAQYPYEDIYQELSITFIKAFDGFNDNLGNKFSTYFVTSAQHHVNKIVKAYEIERMELKMRSVEEMASWSEDGEGSECDLVASEDLTPEERCEFMESIEAMEAKLSPLAMQILTLALDPPEFLEREFHAASSHAKCSRDSGTEKRATRSLNVAFVCDFLDKTRIAKPLDIRMARLEIGRVALRSFA